MNGKQKGFTLIEILVVVTIIGVLAGLVVVLIPKSQERAQILECTNNQKGFVGFIITASDTDVWRKSGPNMILQFINKGDLTAEQYKTLFCPGDVVEGLDKAGGAEAYKNLDMKNHEYDNLTSYAGRDQDNAKCAVKAGQGRIIITCDDSEDHHNKKGFVCGYSDGSVEFREKDKLGVSLDTVVSPGEGSAVKELECLRVE
jgi:prepilin-type N-terminal cleavage/methylation domain-containing protein